MTFTCHVAQKQNTSYLQMMWQTTVRCSFEFFFVYIEWFFFSHYSTLYLQNNENMGLVVRYQARVRRFNICCGTRTIDHGLFFFVLINWIWTTLNSNKFLSVFYWHISTQIELFSCVSIILPCSYHFRNERQWSSVALAFCGKVVNKVPLSPFTLLFHSLFLWALSVLCFRFLILILVIWAFVLRTKRDRLVWATHILITLHREF